MILVKEHFTSLCYNYAEFETEDGKRVIVSPYISDERFQAIKADLEPKMNALLPLLIAKYGAKKS